ncbi:MAG TPA: bifunctional adenosylcobinamide kinase/adenosylcobinamide-phosphate guanylyltransferase [Methylomirabilota bacterium]|nr:bifunctional adenosylcobinamide kinase/adenosylcobinamide-phosphate guanylyltransferase [Methylomirabilota bacterium]
MADTPHSQLILGGARSGKSRYAVAQARHEPGPTAVVATAQPLDPHMAARIARHRAERPPSWLTVEEPLEIVEACRRLDGRCRLALVDCLTLWVSNRLLRGDEDEAILASADELAKLMGERLLSFILVSNEVGEGVHPPTEVGLKFQDVLGAVNQRVAAAADRVTLMVAGIPLAIKDTGPGSRSHERAVEAP